MDQTLSAVALNNIKFSVLKLENNSNNNNNNNQKTRASRESRSKSKREKLVLVVEWPLCWRLMRWISIHMRHKTYASKCDENLCFTCPKGQIKSNSNVLHLWCYAGIHIADPNMRWMFFFCILYKHQLLSYSNTGIKTFLKEFYLMSHQLQTTNIQSSLCCAWKLKHQISHITMD